MLMVGVVGVWRHNNSQAIYFGPVEDVVSIRAYPEDEHEEAAQHRNGLQRQIKNVVVDRVDDSEHHDAQVEHRRDGHQRPRKQHHGHQR